MSRDDDLDPIIEARDDGEVLDRSADGAIECVADGEGMTVRVAPDSELGERLARHAGHRGESPDELLDDRHPRASRRPPRRRRSRGDRVLSERPRVRPRRGRGDDVRRRRSPVSVFLVRRVD
jgi:hypothetical protein